MSIQEQKILDLLTEAHNEYCSLQKEQYIGEGESSDWAFHMRSLQSLIGMRTLIRDYPGKFKSA